MFRRMATITCLTLLCGACDDPSQETFCADEPDAPEQLDPTPDPEDPEDPDSGDDAGERTPDEPGTCEPPADPDADAFARVARAQLQEELDITRIALLDEQDALIADLTVTLDAETDDVHALAQFEYDDTQVEFMVVANETESGTEWKLETFAGQPSDAHKIDLFVAKSTQHGLTWPGGEPVPTGGLGCAGAGIGALGVCGACALCTGASEGACMFLCGAACIGASVGVICACKNDAEHDC
jgi:hypothetical protein